MNYIKVLLINPPLSSNERFNEATEKEMSIVPPLGLCYLAAALEKHGTKVKISDIIGITANTISMPKAISLANIIKNKIDRKIPILLGGPHATALPKETLKAYKQFDIICIGEGEKTIVELTDYFSGKKK